VNVVARFLVSNHNRLGLSRYGIDGGIAAIVLASRFESSRHVVFLVAPAGDRHATLVAKIPRLPGADPCLTNEAAILQAAQKFPARGHVGVPTVVACEPYAGRTLLVETLLPGRRMDRGMISRNRKRCVEAVVTWLLDLPRAACGDDANWYERLVVHPLRDFAARFSPDGEEAELVDRTLDAVGPLAGASLPLVLEHGDLSDPNILIDGERVGVVDWEIAEQRGLPGHDLFFFLGYAAIAALRSERQDTLVDAFDHAFGGSDAWAQRHIDRYATELELERGFLYPLFVACWARYTAKLLERVAPQISPVDENIRRWLHENRNFLFWQCSLGLDGGEWMTPRERALPDAR
jgi:aminoglycoside phosphotransferase